MKPTGLFWASFLIFLGLFFLLQNLNLFQININEIVIFWPILLIIWGITLLNVPEFLKYILSSLSGVLLALVIITFINSIKKDIFDIDDDLKLSNNTILSNEIYSIPIDSNIINYKLEIKSGSASILINSLDTLKDLLLTNATIKSYDYDNNQKIYELTYNPLNSVNDESIGKLFLNENLIYDFDISSGASKMEVNLSNSKVKNFDLEAGVSTIKITIGDKVDTTYVNLSLGAAKLKIDFPKSSNCIINTESALTNKNFKKFIKTNNNQYKYNVENSNKYIFIKYEGAISTIYIEPY